MATVLAQKAPADVVEYTITVDGLDGDPISSLVAAASAITLTPPGTPAPAHTETTVVFWVTGGSVGTDGLVTLMITTTGGRTFQRVFAIPIRTL